MTDRDSKEKRGKRIARARQRQPDFVRKAGPHGHKQYESRRQEIIDQLEEWAEDYEGTHSIFE